MKVKKLNNPIAAVEMTVDEIVAIKTVLGEMTGQRAMELRISDAAVNSAFVALKEFLEVEGLE
jgi:hypothetical protein